MNTIGALAESDPSEHAPLAEPIWTTTPEESGLGVGGKAKVMNLVWVRCSSRCRSSSFALSWVDDKYIQPINISGDTKKT